MRWQVQGAFADSGRDVVFVVEAPNGRAAEAWARRTGVFISGIRALPRNLSRRAHGVLAGITLLAIAALEFIPATQYFIAHSTLDTVNLVFAALGGFFLLLSLFAFFRPTIPATLGAVVFGFLASLDLIALTANGLDLHDPILAASIAVRGVLFLLLLRFASL